LIFFKEARIKRLLLFFVLNEGWLAAAAKANRNNKYIANL